MAGIVEQNDTFFLIVAQCFVHAVCLVKGRAKHLLLIIYIFLKE